MQLFKRYVNKERNSIVATDNDMPICHAALTDEAAVAERNGQQVTNIALNFHRDEVDKYK